MEKANALMLGQGIPRYRNPAVCEVTARKKGVVEKPHASRHLAVSVRFFLNNFAPRRHNPEGLAASVRCVRVS
jgi:hypothetical protein